MRGLLIGAWFLLISYNSVQTFWNGVTNREIIVNAEDPANIRNTGKL